MPTQSAAPPDAHPGEADPGVAEGDVRQFIDRSFIDLLLASQRRSHFGMLAAATLLLTMWLRSDGGLPAFGWFSLMVVVTALRLRYTRALASHPDTAVATRRIALLFLFNGLLLAPPLLPFADYSDLERAALTIVLVALSTASVATTAGFRHLFLVFSLPMLVPLTAAWLWLSASDHEALAAAGIAVLVVLFVVVLMGMGRQAYRVFDQSCRIRFGEKQLNEQLSRALARADEANRAKTQFLAAASHDLRQPIHSLNVLVAALAQRPLDERSREIVDLLGSVNQTLSAELDGLLEISKLDAGAVKPEFSAVGLDQLVRSHHATLAPLAAQAGLDCTVECADEVTVVTDPTLFLRVLGNLTSNALKFTRPGGHVRLVVACAGGIARLTVADTGVGIPQDQHERIFEEFYQVGNVERDRSRGLGLGLSIVRRSCQLLGIRVRLDSRAGVGTEVTLEMQSAAAERGPAPPFARMAPPLSGLSVLVIDDEAQVRHSMRLLLTELGCQVHLADSTESAAHLAAAHRLDVALSDLRLRGEDSGLAALRAVRACQPAARLALVTGDTAPVRIQEARSAGLPLLHKPVTLPALLDVLRSETRT